jgi:hypothetical protein
MMAKDPQKLAFTGIKKENPQDLFKSGKTAEKTTPGDNDKKKRKSKIKHIELNLSLIPRIKNTTVLVQGPGRRQNTKNITLPIPTEIYDRISVESNISVSLIALMQYGLEMLDKKNKTLVAENKRIT